MIRLMLSLLLILSAPLYAGQHSGCASAAESTVTVTAPHHDAHAGHHHTAPVEPDAHRASHQHHGAAASGLAPESEQADAHHVEHHDCDNCDAYCQAACATVATTSAPLSLMASSRHDTLLLGTHANLLASHTIPLLRPPSLFFA